jgi:hypothetical protein
VAKITISNADLVWIFTEKLKSFRDGAPAISIAIVPNKDGWTAIASRNDSNHYPCCAKRIKEVQRELREIYVLASNNGLMGTEPNDAPFEMCGTAVWEVGTDGLLRHNWVERNALEVYGAIGRHVVF